MKYLRFALVAAAASASTLAYAQEEQQQRPPTEIPDFSNLDEYVYDPKSIVTYGFRFLSGAKLSFAGKGRIGTSENAGTDAELSKLMARTYHDGSVNLDARVAARLDSSGNPVRDPDTGSQIFDPIAPDGRTNTWAFQSDTQATAYPGFIAFHNYTADVIDSGTRTKDTNSNSGMELAVSRDMGKLFGTRLSWQLVGGMSINDLTGGMTDKVLAKITTVRDLYSLGGVAAPTAPYSAPSSTTENVADAAGNPVYNTDGTVQTITTDTTVLISSLPYRETLSPVNDTVSVSNRWKVTGAYYTFRAGATLYVPITSRLKLSVSAGPALIYAGSNYAITQIFTPESGAEITDTQSSSTSHLLPGYYADASIQFDLTERTAFYAGAVMQGSGSYTQDVNTLDATAAGQAHYTTKIDLGRQQGFRGGLTIRF